MEHKSCFLCETRHLLVGFSIGWLLVLVLALALVGLSLEVFFLRGLSLMCGLYSYDDWCRRRPHGV